VGTGKVLHQYKNQKKIVGPDPKSKRSTSTVKKTATEEKETHWEHGRQQGTDEGESRRKRPQVEAQNLSRHKNSPLQWDPRRGNAS